MKNTVTIKFGSKRDTDINLDQSIGFDYDAVKRFGLFMCEMQGADRLLLEEHSDDDVSVSVIDMDDLYSDIDSYIVDNTKFVDEKGKD